MYLIIISFQCLCFDRVYTYQSNKHNTSFDCLLYGLMFLSLKYMYVISPVVQP